MGVAHVGLVHHDLCECKVKSFCVVFSIERNVSMRHLQGVQHSYTSHALHPLDIAYFKPFKIAFKKIRDEWTLRNKNKPVEKQILCEWTSKALQRALTSSNI